MESLVGYVCLASSRNYGVLEKYNNELKNISELNQGQIKDYTEESLKELLDYLYHKNLYYREKLEQAGYSPDKDFTLELFQNIEPLSKEVIRNDKNIILCVPPEEIVHIHTSTGTSGGENIYVMYTMNDLYGSDLIPKLGRLFELQASDVVAVALPYEMSSAGQAFQRVAQVGFGAAVLPVGKGGAYSEPSKTIKMMQDLHCNTIFTSPSYIVELMKAAEKAHVDLNNDISLDMIWLTGEGCSDAFRKKIEKKWNTKARFYYGSLECGALGIECETNSGYHIPASHVFLEIINPDTGEALEDGEIGEIVVTTLLKEGTPLLRYRTQDLGYLENEDCECGISLKKLYLRGRKIDQICLEGNEYSPIYVEEMLMRIEEVGFNYYMNVHKDYIEIVIELDDEVEYYEGIEEIISSKLEFSCGIPNKIVVSNEIPYTGKKMRRVNYL